MHIFIALCTLLLGVTLNGMDTPITINPITAPQAYFNELDSRIEREAQSVKEACAQRSLASTVYHLQQLSGYLTQAEERHDDFIKAFQEKQLSLKRARGEIYFELESEQDKECLTRIIEFKLQTLKFISLFEGMTQEDLTAQNWQALNALFRDTNPANNKKRVCLEQPE